MSVTAETSQFFKCQFCNERKTKYELNGYHCCVGCAGVMMIEITDNVNKIIKEQKARRN